VPNPGKNGDCDSINVVLTTGPDDSGWIDTGGLGATGSMW